MKLYKDDDLTVEVRRCRYITGRTLYSVWNGRGNTFVKLHNNRHRDGLYSFAGAEKRAAVEAKRRGARVVHCDTAHG